jgi:predicted MFS family arabinose efflux permease
MSFSTRSLTLALLSTTLLGFFAALVGIPMQTAIQAETPPDMRGKVFGLQNNAVNIALSLPLALAGIAETRFGLRSVLLSLAAISLSGGLVSWYMSLSSATRVHKVDK